MYKTSGRYTDSRNQKKHLQNDGKLKQVYIPHYNKASQCAIAGMSNGSDKVFSPIPCESCESKESINWYHWGPTSLKLRVCHDCWNGWKRRGGLLKPHSKERFAVSESQIPETNFQKQMTILNPTSINRGTLHSTSDLANQLKQFAKLNPNIIAKLPPEILTANQQAMNALLQPSKTSQAFFFHATIVQKLERKFAPKDIFNPRKLSRSPFKEVNQKLMLDNLFSREASEILAALRPMIPSNRVPTHLMEYIATQTYKRSNGQSGNRR